VPLAREGIAAREGAQVSAEPRVEMLVKGGWRLKDGGREWREGGKEGKKRERRLGRVCVGGGGGGGG
jgi:hypothetical protein